MNSNVIGIIVCVAMVICGMGSYFIGRNAGMEWMLQHIGEIVIRVEDDNDQGRSDQTDG